MPTEVVIRRARPDENSAVHELVQTIAERPLRTLFATHKYPSVKRIGSQPAIDPGQPTPALLYEIGGAQPR